jgi:3-methyladenine DNA glycosylase AlkC
MEMVIRRKGARRLTDVPVEVLESLAAGRAESVNLMEWLAVDMSALGNVVADESPNATLRAALKRAAARAGGRSITERLKLFGAELAGCVTRIDSPSIAFLAGHASDIVRQWACYAVNDPTLRMTIGERLQRTLAFADDSNMTVREAAWMAFRPHVKDDLTVALRLLTDVAESSKVGHRRFAVEVTRPRSVWGAHLTHLKRYPQHAEPLLEHVKDDPARYVQLAAGNWLNDAAKSQPDWVVSLCERWMIAPSDARSKIVKRGLRTLRAGQSGPATLFEEIDRPRAQALLGGSDA